MKASHHPEFDRQRPELFLHWDKIEEVMCDVALALRWEIVTNEPWEDVSQLRAALNILAERAAIEEVECA